MWNLHKTEKRPGAAERFSLLNFLVPGAVMKKLPLRIRVRLSFVAGTAAVLVVSLPVFIITQSVFTGKGFSIYSGALCTAAAVFAAALVLVRRGMYGTAAWCVSAGLVVTGAAAAFFMTAVVSLDLMYRGLAYMIMLGACNLLVAVKKKQIVTYSLCIMIIWVAGFFTRFQFLYDADPQRAAQVMIVGIIGIVFVSVIFFLIHALFVRTLSLAEKKNFPAKSSLEKMERLVSDIHEG